MDPRISHAIQQEKKRALKQQKLQKSEELKKMLHGEDASEEEEVSSSTEITKDMDWERFTLVETIYFEVAGAEEKLAHHIEHWDPTD